MVSSSSSDMEDSEVDEGDWRGLSIGEGAFVEGAESMVWAVMERCRATRGGRAVEDIVAVCS